MLWSNKNQILCIRLVKYLEGLDNNTTPKFGWENIKPPLLVPDVVTWRNIMSTGGKRESWCGEGRQLSLARELQSAITAWAVESSSEVQLITDTVTLLSRLQMVRMAHQDHVTCI